MTKEIHIFVEKFRVYLTIITNKIQIYEKQHHYR